MNVKILQTGMDLVTGNSKVGEECFKFVESGLKKSDLSDIGDAAKSVGAKYSSASDISEVVSKMQKSFEEKRKKEMEKLLMYFTAAERKMIENLQDLIENSKMGDAVELAKSIPSRVITKIFAVGQEMGEEKFVSEAGEKLKCWAGKICKENGELFTGRLAKDNIIVKNGLVKAVETETDVIKFKG